MVTVQELGSALIASFEGCRLAAYQDSGGVWTIGIGHTKGVAAGQVITMAQAQAFFAEDQAQLFILVAGRPVLEAAALASFGFNCGASALKEVMAGHSLLTQFVHDVKGNVLPGLLTRRILEETLIALSQDVNHG